MTNDQKREIALNGTDKQAYLLYCYEIVRLYDERPVSFSEWSNDEPPYAKTEL